MSLLWRKLKPMLVWCLVLSFLLTITPGALQGANSQAITLEQAVKNVKEVFQVPQEFSNFSSGYNQYGEKQVWTLNWSSTKEPRGSLNAEVDARTGEITGMHLWQNPQKPEQQGSLPAISRDQAVKIARELLEKIQENRLAELRIKENNDFLRLMTWGPSTYTIQWERLVNGVPFPENGVTVAVDNQTGRITQYLFNWTQGEFPDAGKAISREQANQVFNEAGMLTLQYYRLPRQEPNVKPPIILVYRLTHGSGGVIDALTGKPMVVSNLMYREGMGSDSGSMKMADEASAPLTPEEVKEIADAANLLSQDKAEAIIRQWVTIPSGLTLGSANLFKEDWREPGMRTWSFNWNTTRSDKDAYQWFNARVDAQSGELLSFGKGQDIDLARGPDSQGLSRDEARKLAEEYLRKIQPARFEQVKLQEGTSRDVIPLKTIEQSQFYNFQYERIINGVSFPANGFSISVDALSKEIRSYQMDWSNEVFPPVSGILSAAQATEKYLGRQPLTLQYSSQSVPGEKAEIKLVYRPVPQAGKTGETMTDAVTGQPLDWQGKPLEEQPRPYVFTDISGHWAENEISLLGQAGILGEYGNQFRPDENITAVQLFRAMLYVSDGIWGNNYLSDEQVFQQARQKGWLKEELKAEDIIGRLMMSKYTVRFLGLERAVQAKGIYKVPFTDLSGISQDDLGYVALSWGLGIIKGDGKRFNAETVISRGQAAVILVRLVGVLK